MDFTKITEDRQPVDLLKELIEWHGLNDCAEAYDNYLKELDPIYYETKDYDVFDFNSFSLAKEIADAINIDDPYYVNDAPAIETELVHFLDEWK